MKIEELFKDYDEVLTIEEVHKILKLSKNTIYKLIAKGDIQTIKIGNKHIVPKQNLINYLYPEATLEK